MSWNFVNNILIIIVLQIIDVSSKTCMIDENLRAKNLATKTPYEYNNVGKFPNFEIPQECEPIKFWLVSRHGTRYPSKSGINAINTILPTILKSDKSKLCAKDIEILQKWQPSNLKIEDAKNLHAEGEKELLLLAERFQEKFPKILSSDYHPEDFYFRATNTERAQKSQFYFATGLFGRKEAYHVNFTDPIEPFDPVIRFYKGCQKWQREVKHNISTYDNQKNFEESQFFSDNFNSLYNLLGVDNDLKLLDAIYVGCTFGQAWNPKKFAPWCGILTDYQRKILEFRENLEYFYVDSFGHSINHDQACVLLQDLIKNLDNPSGPKGTFYFTHSGTMLKFLAYLGLDKPEIFPTFDNFGQSNWTTSKIDTFANNIAFVQLSCQKIGMFVNEKLTPIPGCDKDLWCPYNLFKSIFEQKEPCDFTKICQNEFENDWIVTSSEDDRF